VTLGEKLLLGGVGCTALGFLVHLVFEEPEGPTMKGAFMPSAGFGTLAILLWIVGGIIQAGEM
jgi:hypothetical protein